MFVSQPGPHELYDELSRVRVTFFLSHKLVAKRLICVFPQDGQVKLSTVYLLKYLQFKVNLQVNLNHGCSRYQTSSIST